MFFFFLNIVMMNSNVSANTAHLPKTELHEISIQEAFGPSWADLTGNEILLILDYPVEALKVKKISDYSTSRVKDLDGFVNGIGDAVRHCLWSALMTISVGEELASKWGVAHEEYADNPEDQKSMDLYNNELGLSLGKIALSKGWSTNQVENAIVKMAKLGNFKTIEYRFMIQKSYTITFAPTPSVDFRE